MKIIYTPNFLNTETIRILWGLYIALNTPQIFERPLVEIKILFDLITFTGIWLFTHFNLFRNCFHFP